MLISVLIAGFLFFMIRAMAMYRGNFVLTDAYRAPLVPLLVFQALILFVLGTAQVSGGMTAETDEGVIDYQRLIPMTPFSKVSGYCSGCRCASMPCFYQPFRSLRGRCGKEEWRFMSGPRCMRFSSPPR